VEARNGGVVADPVFVGATRPPMRFGVTYSALLLTVAVVMEAFLLTRNLLVLLLIVPLHGVCMLLCARDPRYFDLLMMWVRTRLLGYFCSGGFWRGGSYSPLLLDLPNASGRRRHPVTVRLP
jgi:type IV secretion system protein VirB3